jgi:glycosyltransferase involved in cell wall biosynthesis
MDIMQPTFHKPVHSISVAIATYNRAPMVRTAIAAALEQSRPPLEVVVSDDASIDETVNVVSAMAAADPRVKLFRQAANTGGVRNWNAAIAATRGDFIAWCSDDDYFRSGHLQASAAYLEAHPHAGLVHSGFVDWIDSPEGRSIDFRPLRSKQPWVIDRRNLFRYLLRYYDWPFHPSTIVMRRRVWEEVGPFDPTYALADTDWFVRAASKYSVALLPRYGVNNRRHAGNWSNRLGSARMQQEISAIVEKEITCAYGAAGLRGTLWRQAWKANARLHLLLTVRARLRTGHADAACAAWRALFTDGPTDGPTDRPRRSGWLAEAGEEWLRDKAARIAAVSTTPRQRVSPL